MIIFFTRGKRLSSIRSFMVNFRGSFTKPSISKENFSSSMIGTPPWFLTKCRLFGLIAFAVVSRLGGSPLYARERDQLR